MAVPHGSRSMDVKPLVSSYSKSLWNRLASCADSRLLAGISNLFRRATAPRRTRISLPLPLPPDAFIGFLRIGYLLFICRGMSEASRVLVDVLDDLLEHIFLNLHNIQKNLQFWVSRAEGSSADKVYFMVFERGPRAFIDCTVQVLHDCLAEGSGIQRLCFSASTHISERITILTSLRFSLATFLAQVYMEVDKLGDKLAKDPENSLPLLLVTVNGLFSKLEASIGHLHAMRQPDSSVDGSYSFPLMFEKLPEVNQEGSQWTECEIRDASNVIYQNLQKLDSYLSVLASRVLFKKERAVNAAQLLLDFWNPLVGVIEGIKPECVWIRVVGLPIHIQGDDLWRKIEYRCGGFLWFDVKLLKLEDFQSPFRFFSSMSSNLLKGNLGSFPDSPLSNWVVSAWLGEIFFHHLGVSIPLLPDGDEAVAEVSVSKLKKLECYISYNYRNMEERWMVMLAEGERLGIGSAEVAQHRKPRKVTLYWMRYTCGVVGISVCSIWLLRHSRLTGSPDIDNWIREAKESTVNFWSDHVEQPVSTHMFPVA
ncbi:hypothetical protein RJ639_044305 [Escallonia herrerae]|uniref:Uncharacterized protein n=1 Tax=Escallonia herrerae TaxID=1293975 RepID=A0AA88WDJ9_9ASTE|nr:hypothetical protein RJ639_044305 [Escallonia herrerae]